MILTLWNKKEAKKEVYLGVTKFVVKEPTEQQDEYIAIDFKGGNYEHFFGYEIIHSEEEEKPNNDFIIAFYNGAGSLKMLPQRFKTLSEAHTAMKQQITDEKLFIFESYNKGDE